MKIAISGKGGVGKTTIAALLSKLFVEAGYSVLAIDADPDANLAAVLGFPHAEEIIPLTEMKDLIEERTGAKIGENAPLFKLNPRVEDIPEKYAKEHNGIRLMIMGQIKRGGSGCYCPENALLQALISHLLIARKEVVIMDMVAGIEHLGRATAKSVDKLIIVVEPGRRSVDTAYRIRKLAKDIGLNNVSIVGNKIRTESDKDFLKSSLSDFEILGFLSYDQGFINADIANKPALEINVQTSGEMKSIFQALVLPAKL